MTTRWIRRRPGPDENRQAAAMAFGAGAALAALLFYFLRIFLAREPIRPEARSGAPGDGEG